MTTYEIARELTFPRGDAKILPFTIEESDSTDRVNLNSATIKWQLEDTRTGEVEVSSEEDADISIEEIDFEQGEFEVHLDTTSTSELPPSGYRETLEIVDSLGNKTTWIGKIYLLRDST